MPRLWIRLWNRQVNLITRNMDCRKPAGHYWDKVFRNGIFLLFFNTHMFIYHCMIACAKNRSFCIPNITQGVGSCLKLRWLFLSHSWFTHLSCKFCSFSMLAFQAEDIHCIVFFLVPSILGIAEQTHNYINIALGDPNIIWREMPGIQRYGLHKRRHVWIYFCQFLGTYNKYVQKPGYIIA